MTAEVLAGGLAGCGGPMAFHAARQSRPGIVRGFAAPCAGPPSAATRPITVYASDHNRIVARETRRYSDRRYRLSLPPGRYRISAPGSNDRPRVVVVTPGRTITVNFPNSCS
ncbi:MAG: peptidase associated/transthyretin-like domain-containing protein [Streptosporangiaceae bacterium]